MAEPDDARKHRKQNSIHKRRGVVELSNPNMVAENYSEWQKSNPASSNDFMSAFPEDGTQIQTLSNIFPGTFIELTGKLGIGMIHVIINNLLGVELEGPIGDCDGIHNNQRYFMTPPNCATFIPHSSISRILGVGSAPRFYTNSHDIYRGDVVMVSADIGVGVARYVSAGLVGVELNAPIGNSDGKPYFSVQPNHALFLHPQELKKIHPENLLNKLNLTVERLNKLQG